MFVSLIEQLQISFKVANKVNKIVPCSLPGGGGGLIYETDGDARHLTQVCKFWILVSLRVFQAKQQYFKPPRSHLGFCEETQNYTKRNRSQFFFFLLF